MSLLIDKTKEFFKLFGKVLEEGVKTKDGDMLYYDHDGSIVLLDDEVEDIKFSSNNPMVGVYVKIDNDTIIERLVITAINTVDDKALCYYDFNNGHSSPEFTLPLSIIESNYNKLN